MSSHSIASDYHEATKHTRESLRASRHGLDWASMPDPWRHYDGAPVVDLPTGCAVPRLSMLDVLCGATGEAVATGAELLSNLFFYSAAVSATKVVPSAGYRYALRVNPSSGNLHPTEFHFITRGLAGWKDGVYHYRPSDHTAEQRARGVEADIFPGAQLVIVMSAIAWREAWKYRSRAYRYCCLDLGHAQESVRLAGAALGMAMDFHGAFDDDAVAKSLRMPEDEWPLGILVSRATGASAAGELQWTQGTPNRLSENPIEYPLIENVHQATKNALRFSVDVDMDASHTVAPSEAGFAEVVRARRSALNFIGLARISKDQLDDLLRLSMIGTKAVELYVYVHLVDGAERGVYRYRGGQLEVLQLGDQRVRAAGLSLGQELAGTSCFTLSMIGNFENYGYRQAHFEAGTIGQRLYLAAEAMGMNCTGIGAYFDDEVRRYLEIEEASRQVVYHFAVGHKVHDSRIEDTA